MEQLIRNFPDNLVQALQIAKDNPLKGKYPEINLVMICGMGGSGIGGKLVASWFQNELKVPVICNHDYTLPNYVNENTLVIASSYSGETEETLAAVKEAKQRGAAIVAVCSGGSLAAFCKANNYDCILIPGGNPPRTQLAFSLVQLTHILAALKLIGAHHLNSFKTAAELLRRESESIQAQAKDLADFIFKKELIIYTEAKDEAIAIRARQQFNENSKILCLHHVIPEMNHNELVGWEGAKPEHAVLFLHTGELHPQNKKRFSFSKEVFETKTEHIFVLHENNYSLIENNIFLIHIIDWASYYLALKNNVDPLDIKILNTLKRSLV